MDVVVSKRDSDGALILAARRGCNQASQHLIQKHYKHCFHLALGILRNPDAAEDVAQSTFSRALQHIDTFEGRSQFGTWVSRIAMNESLMLLRRNRRWRTHELEDDQVPAQGFRGRPEAANPEDEVRRAETIRIVREEINRMPRILREALLVCYINGRELSEVAQTLGISEPAAKSRLARARRELRCRLERKGLGTEPPLPLASPSSLTA
jgi:RNA polymerase sigma-70 factor (ECF subfamily)